MNNIEQGFNDIMRKIEEKKFEVIVEFEKYLISLTL